MKTTLRAAVLLAALCVGCAGEASLQRAPDGGHGDSDTGPDARRDGGLDAGSDAGPDAGPDAGMTARDAGMCSSEDTLCLGVCVDTATDGENCGSCGHSCGGGTCAASMCQPVVLAAAQSSPFGLAVDATHVYWTNADGTVVKIPIVGGNPTTLASGQNNPFGVTVDADRVYWVNSSIAGEVMSVPIAGGEPTMLADNQGEPFEVVVANGILYWTNLRGTVSKMPVTGGTPTVLAEAQAVPVGIAVDTHALYWTSIGAGAIRSLPLADESSVVSLFTHQDSPLFIRVRDGNLYWTSADQNQASVFKSTVSGGAPVVLATSADTSGIAVDESGVYWTDASEGTVKRVPLEGGEPTVLATHQFLPWIITTDATNIYWVNANRDGSVMKLAK